MVRNPQSAVVFIFIGQGDRITSKSDYNRTSNYKINLDSNFVVMTGPTDQAHRSDRLAFCGRSAYSIRTVRTFGCPNVVSHCG